MIKEFYLKNGINLLVEERKESKSVAIVVAVNFGSLYENRKQAGIAHLIEHLMFSGTKKRNKKQISEEIDNIGGKINAFTSNDMTAYYVELQDKHLDIGLGVLSDCLQNSLFEEKNTELEKQIILKEINQLKDNLPYYSIDLFQKLCFKDNKMESVIGTKETVGNIKREDILNYYSRFYAPKNFIVSVVGNVKAQEVKEKVKQKFLNKKLPETKRIELKKERQEKREKIIKRQVNQAHLAFGVRAPKSNEKSVFAMEVINAFLGGGLSSRLVQEIREKRGLAYVVHSIYESNPFFGFFLLYVGTGKKNLGLVKELIGKELLELKEKKLGETELKNAKQYIEGKLLLNEENNYEKAINTVKYKQNRIKSTEEYLKKIKEVTAREVMDTAKKYFGEEKIVSVEIRPK
ncbi:MAG: pitrilysin family protein [Candidatus Diapherotrites archaeon]